MIVNEDKLVLIVDDVPENIQVILQIMRNTGYKFAIASDGAETYRALEKNVPDLILLDIMLPDTTGYEICKNVREMEAVKEVPIIFLSAKNEAKDKDEAYNAGGTDYIIKPVHDIELLHKSALLLEYSELRKNRMGR